MERTAYISAMGRAATGVTVVSTDGAAGRFAQTVSAMCSVSADPPMLLVCLNRRSPACDAIRRHGLFCVNVLAADQAHVSDVFAGRAPAGLAPYDFACAEWEAAATGAPQLVGAVSAFDCRVATAHEAGSHTVFIGRVVSSHGEPAPPLLYSERSYRMPAPIDRAVAA